MPAARLSELRHLTTAIAVSTSKVGSDAQTQKR